MPDVLDVRRVCSFLGGFGLPVVHAGDVQRGADLLEHGFLGDSLGDADLVHKEFRVVLHEREEEIGGALRRFREGRRRR